VGIVVKSFNKNRLIQNLKIFDWELSKEEVVKIRSIPQKKAARVEFMLTEEGCLSVNISDIDIIEN
jgi:3''-deamino-3''-oxonicotianamine reductase